MAQSHTREVYADGSIVYSNLFNDIGVPLLGSRKSIEARVITHYWDGTPMTDDKVDNKLYSKIGTEYIEYLFPFWGENFLEKDTMAQMRAMEPWEIILLQRGYWKGVRLNGYYTKNDTPASIEYYISTTLEADDEGSVIEVGGIKLEHKFINEIDIRYFGMLNGTSDDTDKLNYISRLSGSIGGMKMIIPNTVDPYMIYARTPAGATARERGFIPQSNTEYIFEKGARFKIITSASSSYCGISIYNITNTVFTDLWIIGERDEHVGTEGQWGHCIEIYESKNITFNNLTADKAWGDGVYMGATDGITEDQINSNINFLGKTVFKTCRRQGISVISVKDCYIENLYAQDISGHEPGAAIDFEPNFNWHKIDNVYIGQLTAVRCNRSTQFSSQSNFYNITVNNVDAIDCVLPPTFEGLSHTLIRDTPSKITINNWNVNKLNDIPPLRMYNWYPDYNAYVVINRINIAEWIVANTASASSFVNLVYSRVSNDSMINMGGIEVNKIQVSKHSINSTLPLRPFYLSMNESVIDPATKISNIKLNIPILPNVVTDDAHSLIPVNPEQVLITKDESKLRNIIRGTSSTYTLMDGDYIYHNALSVTITITRRGFSEAVLVNSSSDAKVFTMVGGSSSGITTFTGAGGITQAGNTFTINPNAIVKFQRISDSEIRVTLLWIGNRNATSSIKGLVNQSVSLANIATADATQSSVANAVVDTASSATDVAGLLVDHNDLVDKYNAAVALLNDLKTKMNALVTLANATKTSQNTELTNQRTAGQQAP